ncbi:MAG: flagellar export chaperone FliS [Planctomycetaceae bacterium]|nr:flagellar export chaperone FliS [Planctomycetaceae bacterium]
MPSDPAATNAYLANKVLSAKPEELRLMLLDGALKFCRQGRDAMERKDYEGVFNGFQRTRSILVELISTMKPDPDPSLYQRLSSLYLFMISHLLEASHSKDVAKANEVIKLLEYERETWLMLMKKLEGERVGKQPVSSTLSLAG